MKALAFIIVWLFRSLVFLGCTGSIVAVGLVIWQHHPLADLWLSMIIGLAVIFAVFGCLALYGWAKSRLDR